MSFQNWRRVFNAFITDVFFCTPSMPIKKNMSDRFMHRPRNAVSTERTFMSTSSCHLVCPVLFWPRSLFYLALPLPDRVDSYQEWDQTGGRNEANRWGNAQRERSWCDKLCMPARVNTRVSCTVGASRVMNVSWHTLVWQTRTAVCLSGDDGTGSRWTSVWSMNLWTERLLVGVCVCVRELREDIGVCVCVRVLLIAT